MNSVSRLETLVNQHLSVLTDFKEFSALADQQIDLSMVMATLDRESACRKEILSYRPQTRAEAALKLRATLEAVALFEELDQHEIVILLTSLVGFLEEPLTPDSAPPTV
ncbi:hypothetical protein LH464_22065 [Neorhizobium sp. T786]|uniref:hypothetical protein n=1 Tax=Pseudorhizobium xiangyangii TaxID=2883104 RepID=UPI001CFF7F0B|nr:hypothetical protein [Neorhizobium xiangyangii]MCB5205157.1 hypothetical protein [Neorhizobium xiangyangii]